MPNIAIYGQITHEMAQDVCNKMIAAADCVPDEPVMLNIDSTGGTLSAALLIIDMMRLIPNKVVTTCMGRADSAANLILAAAQERRMMPHAHVALHMPTLPAGQYDAMDAAYLRQAADSVESVGKEIAQLLGIYTGRDWEDLYAVMEHGRTFNAQECLHIGLVDRVLLPPPEPKQEPEQEPEQEPKQEPEQEPKQEPEESEP